MVLFDRVAGTARDHVPRFTAPRHSPARDTKPVFSFMGKLALARRLGARRDGTHFDALPNHVTVCVVGTRTKGTHPQTVHQRGNGSGHARGRPRRQVIGGGGSQRGGPPLPLSQCLWLVWLLGMLGMEWLW